MIKTVNIRTLKDKLSAYLGSVQKGDVVLVSDRGTVVAEIRRPTLHRAAQDAAQDRLQQLAEAGIIKLGMPNRREAYQPAVCELSAEVIDAALAASRADR